MYKLHLIRKYLLKRRIAWVALMAVMLCTAMVLIVISVMGGWLKTFQQTFHGMTGDVVINGTSLAGFPYYQEMIDRVQKEVPDVKVALPVIETGALININNQIQTMVKVLGYPANIGLVNKWPQSLHLQYDVPKKELAAATTQPGVSPEVRAQLEKQVNDPLPNFNLLPDIPYQDYAGPKAKGVLNRPGIIVSSALVDIRGDNPHANSTRDIMYHCPVTLTMLPVSGGQQVKADDAVSAAFWIVDDSRSQVYQLDNNNVYMAFDEAQRKLRMDANGDEPARCNAIQIKAKDGANLIQVRDEVKKIVGEVYQMHETPLSYPYTVQTWEESQGDFINAVQREVVLTTALFGIISMVAVLLIFCIFYMIVIEKTKDIGIIKSVGATAGGILQLFLGYGLVIGIVGSGLGFLFAFFFVRYINQLHAWLGREMGIVIWDPKTYQFDTIPNKMDAHTVVWIVSIAILSAVLGAFVPAVRAARMNPVDALRYE